MAGRSLLFALIPFIFPMCALAADGNAATNCPKEGSCTSTQSSPLLQTSKAKISSHREVISQSHKQSSKDVTEHTIQQKSTTHYLDAYEDSYNDYGAAMRLAQDDDSQRWILTKVGENEYTIQQKETMRYLDAWPYQTKDYRVCTRGEQGDDSQKWVITQIGPNEEYTIQQKSTERVLDAYETAYYDYAVVTRTNKSDDTQLWIFTPPLAPPVCQSDTPNFWTNQQCKWTCRQGDGNETQKCDEREDCDGCPNCVCQKWCDTSTRPWSQKCGFEACSACSCCNTE